MLSNENKIRLAFLEDLCKVRFGVFKDSFIEPARNIMADLIVVYRQQEHLLQKKDTKLTDLEKTCRELQAANTQLLEVCQEQRESLFALETKLTNLEQTMRGSSE